MGLFDPAWKTEDPKKLEKALDSVRKTKKPIDLMKIAVMAPLEAVQLEAVGRLGDRELLKEIALTEMTNKYSSPIRICVTRKTRETAVDRLNRQEDLYEIAVSDSGNTADRKLVSLHALSRLTDQELLRKAALNEKGNWQFAAAGKIRDEKVLAGIVEKKPAHDADRIAAAGIGDFDLLLDLIPKLLQAGNNAGYVYQQLDWLLSPPEHFIVDKPDHDRIDIRIENYGRITFHRKGPKAPVTAEQRRKYVEALAQEKREKDWPMLTPEEREYIFWNTVSDPNRNRLMRKFLEDPEYSAERLWNILKPVRFRKGWNLSMDRFVMKKIEARIMEADDPEILLQWIKDPETELHFAAKCLKVLYTKNWAKNSHDRGISTIRDEAVRALLQHLPENDRLLRSYCLTTIVQAVSSETAGMYGITFSSDERDDEDAFGRYSYEQTMIHYNGRAVDYYNGID